LEIKPVSRTKSAYKNDSAEFLADKGPAPSEKIDINGEPAADAIDPATERLRRQLADLRQSEALQQLTNYAVNQAAAEGHVPNSESHIRRSRELFEQHLRPQAPAPEPEPEPEFRPPPPLPPPQADRAAIYSAPVSRETAGTGYRPSPSSTRLSVEQREAARLAGISEVEYARQLQKLGPYKAARGVEHE
jgi:hypothetical protein